MNVLTLSVLGSSGAAGTLEVTFGLHNSSTAPCALFGYPGAQLLDASGTPVGTSVRGGTYSFTNFAPARVSLTGGQSAYFNVGYSDVPGSGTGCDNSARIEITPPNDFAQLFAPFAATVCDNGTITVSPVFSSSSPETQTTAPPQS